MELTPWLRKAHHWQVKIDICVPGNLTALLVSYSLKVTQSPKGNNWFPIPLYKHACVRHRGQVSPWATDSPENYLLTYIFSLAEKGIKLVQEGQYSQAVSMFTEAIKCDPKDYRYIICDHDLLITKGIETF